ncbi:MAG TPA: DUF2784 family protein [Bacteroidetes bacterium]|nr:DUF2784 family protein [Bacteroidota bacterium]
MQDFLLKTADLFFLVFHTGITLFNLIGWIWKKLRKWNLMTLLLTGGSWFLLGIFYGMGYCPLTEWHFRILEKMGETGLPNSYLKYLVHRLTGWDPDMFWVDTLTTIGYFLALICSVYLNVHDVRKNK